MKRLLTVLLLAFAAALGAGGAPGVLAAGAATAADEAGSPQAEIFATSNTAAAPTV